jgi:uncharacterized iron-regulated membrane protein
VHQLNFSNGFRQRLWRWHFFAGLLVCPFLILLAITGSIYLFKAEINNWEEHGINSMSVHKESDNNLERPVLGEQALLSKVLHLYPNAIFKTLTLAKPGDRTVEFNITPQKTVPVEKHDNGHEHHVTASDEELILWVDRYTGDVLERKIKNDRFLNIVKKLHSELLLGDTASYLVELVASWSIILLLSGMLLWTTQGSQGKSRVNTKTVTQIVSPRLTLNRKPHYRNLHGVVGIYLLVPLLLMLLTGLPWTQLWGGGLKELKQTAGWNSSWSSPMQRNTAGLTSVAGSTEVNLPAADSLWSISDDNSDSDTHVSSNAKVSTKELEPRNDLRVLTTLSDIANKEQLKALAHPVYISPPKSDSDVWTVRSMPQNRAERVTLHFDQTSGQQLTRIEFADHHPVQRVISHGISLHEGALFGVVNKVMVLITALLTVLLSILGLITWWKRRPSGSLAAPRRNDQKLSRLWLFVICTLAIFLPAAGISMVFMLMIDGVYQIVSRSRQA